MKKFNYNIIVFALIAVFVAVGWLSTGMISGMLASVAKFIKNPSSISDFPAQFDKATQKCSYQYYAVDINSLIYRLTNTKSVDKEDSQVVLMENGYLTYEYDAKTEEEIELTANAVIQLKKNCDALNKPFLYVYVPTKAYFGQYPDGIDNTEPTEANAFIDILTDNGVEVLSLAQCMTDQQKSLEEMYFITDHHWKPEIGFWASGEILEFLNSKYGYQYDKTKADWSNYTVKVYNDSFLGSQGKKVGRFFTPLGVDDFSVITPNFETDFTVSMKDRDEIRTGAFEDTLLFKNKLDFSSLYTKNPYAAYSGGDFAVQRIENNFELNGKKILVIRDSFACTVTPFLALNAGSVHTVDIRQNNRIDSVSDYIAEYNPDYVLLLYTGTHDMTAFEFDK